MRKSILGSVLSTGGALTDNTAGEACLSVSGVQGERNPKQAFVKQRVAPGSRIRISRGKL